MSQKKVEPAEPIAPETTARVSTYDFFSALLTRMGYDLPPWPTKFATLDDVKAVMLDHRQGKREHLKAIKAAVIEGSKSSRD